MEILKKLMNCHSVSGDEGRLAELIGRMMEPYCDEMYTDAMGNLICFKKGSAENAKKLMLAGHMDEIGFIVTGIDENGFLSIASIGGMHMVSCAYATVVFENGVRGVVIPEANYGNVFSPDRFRIDIGASSKKEAEKKVKVGDLCANEAHVTRLTGQIYSGKPFDDKIGCAIMVRAAMELKECKNDTYYVFTVQEEVGCRGSKTAAYAIMPDFSLAFDVTGTGDAPKARPMAVKMGGGAAIKVKDSSVICDRGLVNYLFETAKANKIPAQLEILEAGGTDTSSMQMAGCGSRACAISVPTRYIHSLNETISKKDYDACVDLTVKLLETDLNTVK